MSHEIKLAILADMLKIGIEEQAEVNMGSGEGFDIIGPVDLIELAKFLFENKVKIP